MSEMPDMNNAESDAATGLAARASYSIHRRLEAPAPAHDRIQLDHLQREKGRLRVRSEAGAEVRVFLERGRTLQVGEVLASDCGRLFEVVAAPETVIRAHTRDWLQFARACYHLGNRHVKLEVGECWLRITPDHVLRDMLEQLGLATHEECAPFVPEAGAYARVRHEHAH